MSSDKHNDSVKQSSIDFQNIRKNILQLYNKNNMMEKKLEEEEEKAML